MGHLALRAERFQGPPAGAVEHRRRPGRPSCGACFKDCSWGSTVCANAELELGCVSSREGVVQQNSDLIWFSLVPPGELKFSPSPKGMRSSIGCSPRTLEPSTSYPLLFSWERCGAQDGDLEVPQKDRQCTRAVLAARGGGGSFGERIASGYHESFSPGYEGSV